MCPRAPPELSAQLATSLGRTRSRAAACLHWHRLHLCGACRGPPSVRTEPASTCQALRTGVCEVEAHLRFVEEKTEAWREQETLSHRGARWKADGTSPALPCTHNTASLSPSFLQGAWPWATSLWSSSPPDVAGGARKSLSLSATVCGIPEFSSIISQQVQNILQLQQDVKTSFVINLYM